MTEDREQKPAVDEAALTRAMEELRGKSRQELLDALENATQKARAEGSLNNTRMDEIYEKLAPYLTEQQRRKMREMIMRLQR